MNCSEVVVIDFETTGLSADCDRVIEVGAVLVRDGQVVDEFSALMDPGFGLPYEITSITGITDEMLEGKPSPEELMPALHDFVQGKILVAHNASFDKRFLLAEMERAGIKMCPEVLCTMLLARRLVTLHNHKLGTLASHLGCNIENAHRALDDARFTAILWNHLLEVVKQKSDLDSVDLPLLQGLSKKPKAAVKKYLKTLKKKQALVTAK
ncbi:MAG: 3'-5' exoribonuclease [Planctomycetes bacterium]|nr:3'-5' exoribonuclease [Planctomycetota bacterium]